MRGSILLLLTIGCAGSASKDGRQRPAEAPTSDTDSDTDLIPTTTPPIEPPTIAAQCEPDGDNTLRFACTVDIDPPGAVQITFETADGSGPSRTHVDAVEAGVHEVGLYFMRPETAYTWTASPVGFPEVTVTGEVTTGTPPMDAQITGFASGVSTADAFLMLSPCGGGMPIVVDSSGTLLWYEAITERKVESLILTEDDTLMLEGGVEVFHFTWMGEELFRLSPGFETLHHDLYRKDGLNYALFRERIPLHGRSYDLDGFYVFDDMGTLLGEWRLIDHFVPPDDPDLGQGNIVIDYSHANSIFMEDDGSVLLSFRHLSTVMKVNGDIADPDFGEVLWTLVGDPGVTDVVSDFVLTSTSGFSADFLRQHNVHRLPDGRIALFDNRLGERARVSILTVDVATGTANVDQTWDTLQTCSFQGSAWSTPAGNPVGHCAPSRTAQEFDLGGYAQATYSLSVSCGVGLSTYVPRAMPLSLY